MSIPKNQHYVPVFYLKNFSNNIERSHIAWYDYSLSKLGVHSAIKRVASQDNIYGKNGEFENTFAHIESAASKVISNLIVSEQLIRDDRMTKILLWIYTLIQFIRTSKRIGQFSKVLNNVAKNIKGISEQDAEVIKTLKVPSNIIIGLHFQNFFQILSDTLDLHCKLVINRSSLPFITSDHPVISYNQFLEKKEPIYNGNGLFLKGTQIFFPISPKHLIIFFDHDIYKVGSAKSDVCITTSIEDVKNLNSLSALNAAKKIFFSNQENHKPVNYYADFRNKYISKTTGTEIPKTGLKLSFIKELDKAKIWKPKGSLSYFRNPVAGLKSN